MDITPRLKTTVTCTVCGRQCESHRKGRNICRKCYRQEASKICINCGNRKRLVSSETGLCPRCANVAECGYCSEIKVIHNVEAQLCKTCDRKARRRMLHKKKQVEV